MRIRRPWILALTLVVGTTVAAAPAVAGDPVEQLQAAEAVLATTAPEAIDEELREFAGGVPASQQSNARPGEPKPPRTPRQLPPPKLQCTSAGVEAFVRRYVVAFNRGKLARVRGFFVGKKVPIARGQDGNPTVVDPDRRGFRWYTVAATKRGLTRSARTYFIGRNRNRVAKYVKLRRKRGERLRFVTTTGFRSLKVGRAPHAGIAFLMKRRANDLLPRKRWRTVKGKALIDCQSGKVSAFSV